MLESPETKTFISALRILFCIVLFEYAMFIFSGVSFSFLYGDPFFELKADPFSWIVFGSKIPQFIVANRWAGLALDFTILMCLLLFIRNPLRNRLAVILLVLLFLFYVTLMGYLSHRNFQFGFFIVFIPFIFKKSINRHFAFEATRYFLLFFYLSAALLKIANASLSEPAHFSHMLVNQFTPYFLEGNTGLRTDINLYLINHSYAAFVLYLSAFLCEFVTLAGFFTRRFDKWIAMALLLFHFMNWLIMDIAPWGQLGFISLLFVTAHFQQKSPQGKRL